MRRTVGFLVTRLLRSRLGVALLLAVLIMGMVGTARALSGPTQSDGGLIGTPVDPISTADPHAGDDGAIATQPPATPYTSPGAATPKTVADRFVAAWLTHQGVTAEQWHAALRPFSTAGLTEKLSGADPASVPVDRVTAEPTLIVHSEQLVEVIVPVDSGRLRLELVASQGRWLVDVVDWER